jgi:hypothetical protein
MPQTTPPTITPAPAVPIRGTPTFKSYVDAFLTWLALVVAQFQALAANVYSNGLDAADSASAAAGSMAAAVSATGVTVWVSGTVYASGVSKYSPLDFRTYRSRAAVTSANDPSIDPTNWVLLSVGAFPLLHVSYRVAAGTNGESMTAVGTISRTLNTTVTNSIAGASLASSNVTLPAGTYDCCITCPAVGTNLHKATLYDVTAAATLLIGSTENAPTSSGVQSPSTVRGRFTITAAHVFTVKHFAAAAGSGGSSATATSGLVEVYTEAQFWKVA